MKKYLIISMAVLALVGCGGSANTTKNSTSAEISSSIQETGTVQQSDASEDNHNVLIAYFSWASNVENNDVDSISSASIVDGNYHIAADYVKNATGGDLFEIKTETTYPVDYDSTTHQASEEKADNFRPVLTSHIDNISDYDTVVLVYPNWWGTYPMAIASFTEEYDLSGKTVMPICTNEGSGMGTSESDLAQLLPDSDVREGLAIRGGDVENSENDINKWLTDNGVI